MYKGHIVSIKLLNGDLVTPVWVNVTGEVSPVESMAIDYVLQDYTNLLNFGYNGSSHTEPYYRIYSYLILSSDRPFANYTDLAVESVNLLNGADENTKKLFVRLLYNGSTTIGDARIAYVINNKEGEEQLVTINLAPGEKFEYEFDVQNVDVDKPGLAVVYAEVPEDKVASNNSRGVGFGRYTKINESFQLVDFKMFPNPATNRVYIEANQEIQALHFHPVDGRFVKQVLVEGDKVHTDLSDLEDGVYFVSVHYKNNRIMVKSLVKK